MYDKAKELVKNPEDPKFLEEARKLYKEAFYVDAPESWEAKHFKSLFDKQVNAFEDMTPADFHRMLTKSVDDGNGLVFDRSPGNVVWNYPASGYESDIKKTGTKEIDGKTVDVFEVKTKVVFGDYSDYTWNGGGGYTYDLYVDENGNIVGGEWTGSSIKDHPDFAWKPTKSLKDLEDDPTRNAEKRKMTRDAKLIERYLEDQLKNKGYDKEITDRLREGDYIYVLDALKTKKDDELREYVSYLENLNQELTFRSIYTGARTLHDKYATPPPAATPATPATPVTGATPTADNPAPGPSVSDRLNEAGNAGGNGGTNR